MTNVEYMEHASCGCNAVCTLCLCLTSNYLLYFLLLLPGLYGTPLVFPVLGAPELLNVLKGHRDRYVSCIKLQTDSEQPMGSSEANRLPAFIDFLAHTVSHFTPGCACWLSPPEVFMGIF